MNTHQAEILLPFVASFEDYHLIEDFKDKINTIIIMDKIKAYEFGFDGGYVAVFYRGKRPSQDVIKFLVRHNPDIDDENIEWKHNT